MKETLILQNKIYISAKRAVLISGYNSDYIGQLCRENKLDCNRVGRSWFVTEDSLLKHKQLVNQEIILEKPKAPPPIDVKSDSVIVDRKNFISSKRASEISGYTCDYIGQLCRLGKLESTRVGNAWFVSEKSILNHCINLAQESTTVEKKSLSTSIPVPVPITEKKILDIPVIVKKEVEINKSEFENLKRDIEVKNKTFEDVKYIEKRINEIPKFQKKQKSLILVFYKSTIIGLGISLVILLIMFEALTSSTGNFSKESQLESESKSSMVASALYSKPALNALAVVPSSGSVSQDEVIKKKIQSSFSDEVKISSDESGTAGVITPVFKKTKDQGYVYVLVPVNKP